MSIIINKLHTNNTNNEFNYYSIRINTSKNINDDEILLINNEYLHSLSETPNIKQLSKNKIFNHSDYYRMKLISTNQETLKLIVNLIIKTLIGSKDIEIYEFSSKQYIKLQQVNQFCPNYEYIIKSKFINMCLFYQIIYSISKKSKTNVVIMINKHDAYELDLNIDSIKCVKSNTYNINDYKNIGNEYHNICNAYIDDMKAELYLKD